MLSFDQQMNLVNRGLAIMKNDGKFTTFKYHRRAMYEYLWHDEPALLNCRGHVYSNATKELVQAAPKKSFNYLEQGYWSDVPLNTHVALYKKINGYLACVTLHDGELLVSTTGSTTSEYAQWAKELILKDYKLYDLIIDKDATAMFEVIVPQDPHIVEERYGLHLLGYREKNNGNFHPNGRSIQCTLEQALKIVDSDRGEGFMMYPLIAGEYDFNYCCKLKTPYYVGKKKLMRMTAKNVEVMYKNPNDITKLLPSMWHDAPFEILRMFDKDQWLSFNDQQRRVFLEDIERN